MRYGRGTVVQISHKSVGTGVLDGPKTKDVCYQNVVPLSKLTDKSQFEGLSKHSEIISLKDKWAHKRNAHR